MHSLSERFPFLDRNLRFLSRASSWIYAQGCAVGKPPVFLLEVAGPCECIFDATQGMYAWLRAHGLLLQPSHQLEGILVSCNLRPIVNGKLHRTFAITVVSCLVCAYVRRSLEMRTRASALFDSQKSARVYMRLPDADLVQNRCI